MNILRNNPNSVKIFIVIFYCVGLLGLVNPATKLLFINLIPLALLLSFGLLLVFHNSGITRKDFLVFITIFGLSFLLEAVGVKTGIIFGDYTYGDSLGIKIFQTPLIIGINWLFLTYTVTSITDRLPFSNRLKILTAPILMVIYDLALEQVAPSLDMWSWANSTIPMQNYLAWYFISLGLIALLKIFRIDTRNPLSFTLFACQFIFFAILVLII